MIYNMSSYSDCNKPSTLVELLRWRATELPNQQAYIFLVDGETEEVTLTYEKLDRQARAIGAWLQARGLEGERALLIYPVGLKYIAAFFGCLYAGVIPVPAYPPRPRRLSQLQKIVADAQATVALSTTNTLSTMQRFFAQESDLSVLQWLTTDNIAANIETAWQEPKLTHDSLAFLQYTAGSTGEPKGVMVSHGNVLHNQALIYNAFEHTPHSKVVSWLPPYHDMGLIGGILQPLYGGFSCILMSPTSFVQSPFRWLQAISRYKATTSGGPNFSYDLCTRKIAPEQRAALDLSHWSVAFNGAEPIYWETLERFTEAFSICGFRQEAFYPCYGLAEATLMVSGGMKAAKPIYKTVHTVGIENNRVLQALPTESQSVRTLVGCGQTRGDQKIVIVHPETLTECAPDQVGEIWVSGSSIAQGYWNKQLKTEKTFQAHLIDLAKEPFLRTGDLGFLQNGELFVTGRLKDLIIIRGRNHYPQDIELTVANSHPNLQRNSGAAFAIEVANEERLVVVQEVDAPHRTLNVNQVVEAIRQRVAEEHEVDVYAVVLIKHKSIPRTTSGKIQRFACRKRFLAGTLEVVGEWSANLASKNHELDSSWQQKEDQNSLASRTACMPTQLVVEEMLKVWAEVLGVARIGIHDNFFVSGGNSLLATQLISRLYEVFDVELPVDILFEAPTVAELVERMEEGNCFQQSPQTLLIQALPRNSEVLPLSFAQQRMCFLEQLVPGNPFYNIAVKARLRGALNVSALKESFRQVLKRHEALRATFSTVKAQLIQIINPNQGVNLPVVNLEELSESEQETEVQRLANEDAKQAFDLSKGPMLRTTLLQLGNENNVLLLMTHHVVCDGWALGVLIREVNLFYSALNQGQMVELLPLSIQYGDFCLWQTEVFAKSASFEKQAFYWRNKFSDSFSTLNLPTDFPQPKIRNNQGKNVSGKFDCEFTKQLKEFSKTQNVTLFMTMLCGLNILLHQWTHQSDIIVGTVVANRNKKDLEHLIGCFINFLPIRTDLSGNPPAREVLRRVKNNTIEAYANQDYPFEKLVYDINPSRNFGRNPIYNVGFWLHNYSVPVLLNEWVDADMSLIDTHSSELDLRIVAIENTDGSINTCFEFALELFEQETISLLYQSYCSILKTLVQNPDLPIDDFHLLEKMQNKIETATSQKSTLDIAITANFTAEALKEPILFWTKYLGISAKIEFAPYNQIFQELLDPSSLICLKQDGVNIILLSLEDWLKANKGTNNEIKQEVEQNVRNLILALNSTKNRGLVSYLVCLCPPSRDILKDSNISLFINQMHSLIYSEVESMRGVYAVDLSEAVTMYNVLDVHDPFMGELGHIPFTSEFFTAAGTLIGRKIFALQSPPYKVIVLDCDHTLWSGICGEDGYNGIQVTSSYCVLQRFMLKQKQSGMLLCLCSKNNESDVFEVFQNCSQIILKLEDFVAWRVNWEPKSRNLKSLAEELEVGLDSFIFLDDDPVECEEVRKHCPEVLTLQLPRQPEEIPEFLNHVWAFDRLSVTEEDKNRTLMYKQNMQRKEFKRETLTLEDFLAELKLEISISPIESSQVKRVAQLTQRTNQFNATVIRRTESEIEELLATKIYECLVVNVSDRFGDYGLVGVIIFETQSDALKVDTFLLSCRALGRNVEQAMLKKLGVIAEERGCQRIQIPYIETPNNSLLLKFLNSINAENKHHINRGVLFRLNSKELLKISGFQNQKSSLELDISSIVASSNELLESKNKKSSLVAQDKSDVFSCIATQFQTADQILTEIRYKKSARPELGSAFVAPRTPVEQLLANIWIEVLGVENIGVHDDFFKFGGHSLLATQLLSRVRDEFQVELSLESLFDTPTISGLTMAIVNKLLEKEDSQEMAQVLEEFEQLSQEEANALLNVDMQ